MSLSSVGSPYQYCFGSLLKKAITKITVKTIFAITPIYIAIFWHFVRPVFSGGSNHRIDVNPYKKPPNPAKVSGIANLKSFA